MATSAFKSARSIYELNPDEVLLRVFIANWQVPTQQKLWNDVILNWSRSLQIVFKQDSNEILLIAVGQLTQSHSISFVISV